MARREVEGPVTLSVLDRLIDLEPNNRAEAPLTRPQSLRLLKVSLKRELEWLLNTRQTPEPIPESARELPKSLYAYGLPDFAGLTVRSPRDQTRLARQLEAALSAFEPRLANVRVAMEPVAGSTRTLRFVIEGVLLIDPAPERVTFDTVLELTSGEYQVKGDTGAR